MSFMESEMCIEVDVQDRYCGPVSKRDCHTWHHRLTNDKDCVWFPTDTAPSHDPAPLKGYCILHRAFSVFLFDTQSRLLLQQRASTKITFAQLWTNTCCSHPLANIALENERDDGEQGKGVMCAAVRKLHHELGIEPSSYDPLQILYLTRIHYGAPCVNRLDSEWGEHEIDYILLMQVPDVTLHLNPNEVSQVQWIDRKSLLDWVKQEPASFTPWFRLVVQHSLDDWWQTLEKGGIRAVAEKHVDRSIIQRFGSAKRHEK